MKVFITGINGLVGSFVAKRFLNNGHEVVGLIRKNADLSLIDEFKHKIKLVEGDILDTYILFDAIAGNDWVIHAAAMVSFIPKDKNIIYKINVEGTANVVNACLANNIKKLCYVSSVAAIGKIIPQNYDGKSQIVVREENQWVDENAPSHYGKSKHKAELEVWRGIAEGLNAVIVNPSVILGEANWNKSSTRLFKYIYDENKFYTGGLISYVDVEDVSKAIFELTKADIAGERFILSAGSFSYFEFFKMVSEKLNKKAPSIKVVNFWTGIIWRIEAVRSKITGNEPLISKETAHSAKNKFVYDSTKIVSKINFQFSSIDETLKRISTELIKKYK